MREELGAGSWEEDQNGAREASTWGTRDQESNTGKQLDGEVHRNKSGV